MGRHDVKKSAAQIHKKTERGHLPEPPLMLAEEKNDSSTIPTAGSVTWPQRPRRTSGPGIVVPVKSISPNALSRNVSDIPCLSSCGKLKWPIRPQRSMKFPNLDESGAAEVELLSRCPSYTTKTKAPDRKEYSDVSWSAKCCTGELPHSAKQGARKTPPAWEDKAPFVPACQTGHVKKNAVATAASPPSQLAQEKHSRTKETWPLRFLRVTLTASICAMAVGFYFLWAKQSAEEAMPPLFIPQPYFYEEEQPVHALLLWHEKVLTAPSGGMIQLAYGGKLAVVANNEVVATVLSRGRTTAIRTPARGYFLPAIDGVEDRWDYPTLWLSPGLLPKAPELQWIEDLKPLNAVSRTVGKLIYLPQEPRAIFYLNLTDQLRTALKRGSISIRRNSKGPKWTAHVRVYVKYGDERAKVVLDMPYFPMDMALSREVDFLVCSEEDAGLVVPNSAVTIRHGTYGVFELVGDRLIFRSVTGKLIEGGRFFIASGLSAGNPVILEAANAEEKRVRLW